MASAETHSVVAAVVRRQDQVLLCRRRPDLQWYPGVWDLPGGHVEAGETPAEALVRELMEELGIVVAPPEDEPLATVDLEDGRLWVWAVAAWRGQATNRAEDEHDTIGWFTAAELRALDLADPAIAEVCLTALGG